MGNAQKSIDNKFLSPNNGLYPSLQQKWDLKSIRRQISDRKVAPFYPGTPDPKSSEDEECPICMLYYTGGLNRSLCCNHRMCTECYFSIKPTQSSVSVQCPFCQRSNYSVCFTGPLTPEERRKQEEEEKKVHDLEAKIRQEEIERDLQRQNAKKAAQSEKQNVVTPENPKVTDDTFIAQLKDVSLLEENDLDDALLREAIALSLADNPDGNNI